MAEETHCGVCWEKVDKRRVVTPCNHLYCSSCFFKWMKEKRTCPACRKNFDDEEIKNREELLHEINEDIASHFSIFRLLRYDNNNLKRRNHRMEQSNNTLERLIAGKKKEIYCLEKERRITREALQAMINYRREWEELYEHIE